jgi:hypothetical protein
MSYDEIIEGLIDLLRQHKEGVRGSIGQEPNKGDLFKLFSSASKEGFLDRSAGTNNLRADAMADTLVDIAPELVDSSAHNTTWSELYTFWREWTYAWTHADERRR